MSTLATPLLVGLLNEHPGYSLLVGLLNEHPGYSPTSGVAE